MVQTVRFWILLTTVTASLVVSARPVDVVSGWDKPPYIISEGDTGFEVELVKAVLAGSGYEAKLHYVPMGRSVRLISEQSMDIALSMNDRQALPEEWLTDVYVVYQNVVITRHDRKKVVRSLEDLKNMTVVGFQTASQALGKAYEEVVATHPGYLEVADQQRQVSMLLLGSVDAIVMDHRIFDAIRSSLPAEQQVAVDLHPLFDDSPYRAAIPNPALRRAFNQGLREMRKNGEYEQLARQFMLDQIVTSYAQIL